MPKKKNDPVQDELDAARERQAEIVAEQEKEQSVTPTPTQDENDRAKLGQAVELAAPEVAADDDDASKDDGKADASKDDGKADAAAKAKQETAGAKGSYQTRQQTAG